MICARIYMTVLPLLAAPGVVTAQHRDALSMDSVQVSASGDSLQYRFVYHFEHAKSKPNYFEIVVLDYSISGFSDYFYAYPADTPIVEKGTIHLRHPVKPNDTVWVHYAIAGYLLTTKEGEYFKYRDSTRVIAQ